MEAITTIGLDIAKSVFQVHGIDAEGNVILRRQLKRRYVLAFFQKLSPCLVGIEACASSHHWSRELQALGHTVRLMPPAYVKPYGMKRQHRTMRTDAEAICEAAITRPNMRSFRRDQDARAAELPDAAPYPAPVHPPADLGDQRHHALILQSLGSSRRSDAKVSSNCSGLLPIQMISGCPRNLPVRVLPLSVPNCGR